MTPAPVQAAGFPNARTGVAQRAEQKLVFAVGHIVEQGAHFWRKKINGVTPFDVAIRLSAASAVEKSTSCAIPSTPVRSGEFCRVTWPRRSSNWQPASSAADFLLPAMAYA